MKNCLIRFIPPELTCNMLSVPAIKTMTENRHVVLHYKNIPDTCSEEGRCRVDRILTAPAAEKLLVNALHQTVVYKFPHNCIRAMDTFYVESFNNTLNGERK